MDSPRSVLEALDEIERRWKNINPADAILKGPDDIRRCLKIIKVFAAALDLISRPAVAQVDWMERAQAQALKIAKGEKP